MTDKDNHRHSEYNYKHATEKPLSIKKKEIYKKWVKKVISNNKLKSLFFFHATCLTIPEKSLVIYVYKELFPCVVWILPFFHPSCVLNCWFFDNVNFTIIFWICFTSSIPWSGLICLSNWNFSLLRLFGSLEGNVSVVERLFGSASAHFPN